ncbi:IS5 family transposase [Caldalkalibacillus uzonensis]|uniref:IS5 family transposase n=1 Tax=Caldalkalibacillus uzonensis TaxID=353224 RepID=A0ABU0CY02_9BACI|nr:transposase [Caldalkalibacillus uzonensis]MDQ0341032.1 IS5 family transposase [Caldalkalibacillus uzonensis]
MDKENVYPEKAVITPANEHDRSQLEVLVDEKEAMYVFDHGYVNYETLIVSLIKGSFLLLALRKGSDTQIETFEVPKDSPILSESMVLLGTPQ